MSLCLILFFFQVNCCQSSPSCSVWASCPGWTTTPMYSVFLLDSFFPTPSCLTCHLINPSTAVESASYWCWPVSVCMEPSAVPWLSSSILWKVGSANGVNIWRVFPLQESFVQTKISILRKIHQFLIFN